MTRDPKPDLTPEQLARIAAFIDDSLDERERAEVVEWLGESDAAYSVFAEVSAMASEEAPDEAADGDPGAPPPEGPTGDGRRPGSDGGGRWSPPAWLAIAATVAAVGLFSGRVMTILRGPRPVSTLTAMTLVDRLDAGLFGAAALLITDPLPVTRNSGLPPASPGGYAFRLGVRTVEAKVFARSGLQAEADVATERIDSLLARLTAPTSILDALRRAQSADSTGIPSPVMREQGLEVVARWLDDVEELLRLRYEFGLGTEAARVAALGDDLAFLASPDGRAFLDLTDRMDLSPEARSALDTLRTLLGDEVTTQTSSRVLSLLRAPMVEASN